MDQALDIAPSDYWRWHLIANAPESSDTAFTWEEFQLSVNSDLANVLGNFVNRITKYACGKFEGKVPEGGKKTAAEEWLLKELNQRIPLLISFYEKREFRKAMSETRAIWAAGNEYLTQAAPWTHYKTDINQAAMGVRVGLNLVSLFGILAQPIIPDAASKILDAMNIPENNRSWNFGSSETISKLIDALPFGHEINSPDVLFAKIEDNDVEIWAEKFKGND
jgi:methionyl-tRNA synthetase